jgi:hypothetical protein
VFLYIRSGFKTTSNVVSCKKFKTIVTPAKAGVQFEALWIPVFAEMTERKKALGFNNNFVPNFRDTKL